MSFHFETKGEVIERLTKEKEAIREDKKSCNTRRLFAQRHHAEACRKCLFHFETVYTDVPIRDFETVDSTGRAALCFILKHNAKTNESVKYSKADFRGNDFRQPPGFTVPHSGQLRFGDGMMGSCCFRSASKTI